MTLQSKTKLIKLCHKWELRIMNLLSKTISEAVVEPEFKEELWKILKPAFSDEGREEDRLNPNFRVLQEVVEKLDKPNKSDVQAGLYKVRCFARRAFSTLDFAS